jgi:ACS family hexuronate transporter-like MFS transporter
MYIRSDYEEPAARIPWARLLPHPEAWAFAVGKFITDPVWWLYLFWIPDFLNRVHGLQLTQIGPPLVAIYLISDAGSIGGGWLSSRLIARGWSVNAGRKTAMLVCAVCVVPIVFASQVTSMWGAVGLISLAAAAHQGWSANIFTLASDMFPKTLVGSVTGLAGMSGAIGGMFMTLIAGGTLQWFGSYVPLFVIAGLMHPLAFTCVLLFAGRRLDPADVGAGLKAGRSRALIAAGAVMAVVGAGLASAVWLHWDAIVAAARSLSAAAQGLVASVGVMLLGLALLYAGRGRHRATS